MLSVGNVATPLDAATGPPPLSVPPPVLFAKVSVTFPMKLVAVFPRASRAATWTVGVIGEAALVVLGRTANASCVGDPGVMLNVGEVAPLNPVAEADRGELTPALSVFTGVKLAIPPEAVTVPVPRRL